MNQGSNKKFASNISVESLRSKNSMSLGRPSWSNRYPSLSNKPSLVYVMSVQSDKKSDIYERMLHENIVEINWIPPRNRNSLENTRQFIDQQDDNNKNKRQQAPDYFEVHRGSQQHRTLHHTCQCYMNCDGQQCPCFSARDQICRKESCCETCIQMKNTMLLSDRGEFCSCKHTQCLKSYCKCFQNNGICTSLCRCEDCKNKIDSKEREEAIQTANKEMSSIQTQRRHCTCKKTKCNKKYCSCLAVGIKCTKLCECENCNNCDKVSNEMSEQGPPEFVGEQNMENLQFPERMSFQQIQLFKY